MAVIEYTFLASRDKRRLDSIEHLGLAKKVGLIIFLVFVEKTIFFC